jgi:hypothetical protein
MAKVRFKQARQVTRAGGRGKVGVALSAVIGLWSAGGAALAQDGYHPAETAAEIALKRVLAKNFNDGFNGLFVTRSAKPRTAGYGAYMTKPLMSALTGQYRAELKRNCNGLDHGDGYCAFDIGPIDCTDAGGPDVFVRTDRQEGGAVYISYKWDMGADTAEADYRMVHTRHGWKLDGIYCRYEKLAFNMRPAKPKK